MVLKYLEQCLLYLFSAYYGVMVFLMVLVQVLKKPSILWNRKYEFPTILHKSDWGIHKYMQLKDIKIHYVEKGNPTKPLMLFVHGFPEFWFTWRHQLKEFSKDYWCVAIDMRGFGESDKPKGASKYVLDNLVEDINQFVSGLGRKKFTLVGHDWGAVVSWAFLERHADMVDKYVISNGPPLKAMRELLLKSSAQRQLSWYVYFFQIPCFPEIQIALDDFSFMHILLPKHSKEEMNAYKYTLSQPGCLTAMINYYRNVKNNYHWLQSKPLPDTRPPGFFFFSKNDGYIMPDIVDIVVKQVPNLTSKIVPDVGHFCHEEEPQLFNRIVREFLEAR